MPALAVARLWFCSNSFNPRRTRMDELLRHEWVEGADAEARTWPWQSEISGALSFAAERPGWRVSLLRCAAAPPGGPLGAEVLGAWLADVSTRLRDQHFDALYLSLSGACQVEGDPAADLSILRALRAICPRLPIVATFDSCANLSEEMALLLDGASVLRGPADGALAARRTLTMLEGLLEGRWRPVGALARVPALLTPGRLARVLAELGQEQAPGPVAPLLDCSVCSGFAWADTPHSGPAALVWADCDAGAAREAASSLALRLARGPEAEEMAGEPAAETLARARAPGRTLILDAADDPELGGLGDTPALLRALLESQISAAFGVLADPLARAATAAAGEGAELDLALGAAITPVFGQPAMVRGRVMRVLDGLTVVRAGSVFVLIADRPTRLTRALFASAGIDLATLPVLGVKGGRLAKAEFDGVYARALNANCPGPTSPDLAGLPFTYVAPARRAPGAAERFAAEAAQAGPAGWGRDDRRGRDDWCEQA